MIQIFNKITDYEQYTNNGLKSGTIYYVKEDESIHFYTNNIDGTAKVYNGGDTESITGDLKGIIERSISEIVMPDGVTTIGEGAFKKCTSLSSVTIPNSVTSIADDAFFGCSSLTSVTISNSVTSIGKQCFYNCSQLSSITIESGVTNIKDYAFYQCPITELTIPDSVTTIGTNINSNNSSLTTLIIGEGVTNMFTRAFAYNSNLTYVYVYAETPPVISSSRPTDSKTIFDDASENLMIYVPEDSVAAYKAAEGWSVYADKITGIIG